MFAVVFLWRRVSEVVSVKLNGKYRQNLVVDELYVCIGLKKSCRWISSYHPHTVAHLCKQLSHVFAVRNTMPCFNSNNLYQTRPKIQLLLQKNCKFASAGGFSSNPQSVNGFRQLGAPPPYQKTQPSRCKFLAFHLNCPGKYWKINF